MDIEAYVEMAMDVILKARMGMIDCEDALDSLWELLVNIDYEVKHPQVIAQHERAMPRLLCKSMLN